MIGEDVMKMERETAMYFKYKDLAEFEKVYNDPVAMREITGADCSCGARREMKLETVTVDIGNYHIGVQQLWKKMLMPRYSARIV